MVWIQIIEYIFVWIYDDLKWTIKTNCFIPGGHRHRRTRQHCFHCVDLHVQKITVISWLKVFVARLIINTTSRCVNQTNRFDLFPSSCLSETFQSRLSTPSVQLEPVNHVCIHGKWIWSQYICSMVIKCRVSLIGGMLSQSDLVVHSFLSLMHNSS